MTGKMKSKYRDSSKRDSYWDKFYFRWLEKSVIEIGKAASIALISNHLNWKPSEVCRITRTEKPIGPGTNWLGEWQERIILKFVYRTRKKSNKIGAWIPGPNTLHNSMKKNSPKNAKKNRNFGANITKSTQITVKNSNFDREKFQK